ncbi:hypothetical protein [Alkalicoccobacillus porphyridii]|uniref:Uncharacterized protein n=1 Tax=Alkalicoccobacillus porphyridii TaxID=2597270 RepID=A0A554A0A5_9BACI|nr:hypothetical protein [Alkalicoccobacillus porphyridii]TSB47118.1 hypothetical protein FN960_08880 [Alkalicoccobacillus porphyridii]
MKKIMITLACSVALVACSQGNEEPSENEEVSAAMAVDSEQIDEEVNEPLEEAKEEPEEEIEEAPEAPERTVELDGREPWESYNTTDILALAKDETVFIMDDAEALEDEVIIVYESGIQDRFWHGYINVFVMQTEPYYPEHDEYFDELREIGDLILEGELDTVPVRMREAQELRESNM